MRRIQSFASSVNLIVEWSARCQHEWRESFPQLSNKIHFELKTLPNVSPPPHPLIKLHWNLKKFNLFSHIECSPLGCSRLKWTLQTRSHYSWKLRKNSNYLHPTRLVWFFTRWKVFLLNEIFFEFFPCEMWITSRGTVGEWCQWWIWKLTCWMYITWNEFAPIWSRHMFTIPHFPSEWTTHLKSSAQREALWNGNEQKSEWIDIENKLIAPTSHFLLNLFQLHDNPPPSHHRQQKAIPFSIWKRERKNCYWILMFKLK